jgi:hypothetical protein
MKTHGYVRSNIKRVVAVEKKEKNESKKEKIVPKFSQFVYYFFAPTLIYSDNYPK